MNRTIPHEYQVHDDGGDGKGSKQFQPLVVGEAADLTQGLESHRGAELRQANLE